MGKIGKLWDKLPKFMLAHRTVRTTIMSSSADVYEATPWVDKSIDESNLITSQVERYPYGIEYHRPVLDLDFEAELIPSSTPGHYHLFLDKQMPKREYMNLLRALAAAGIIEQGFADCSIERGASSVRLPWIKKDDWAANQGDPDRASKELQRRIEEHEKEAARLREQLDRARSF